MHRPLGLSPPGHSNHGQQAVSSRRGHLKVASPLPHGEGAGTAETPWSSAAELKAGGRWQRWDPLSWWQSAAISTQKRC